MATGIRRLHSKGCPASEGGRCSCRAGWEASIWSNRDGKRIYKTFRREAEARSWRAEAKRGLDLGTLRAPSKVTLADASEEWIEGAKSGVIRNRSGQVYKPATVRGYRQRWRKGCCPRSAV